MATAVARVQASAGQRTSRPSGRASRTVCSAAQQPQRKQHLAAGALAAAAALQAAPALAAAEVVNQASAGGPRIGRQ